MSIQNKIGLKGERLAIDFLIKKSYEIVETNWRFSKSEIDIIAKKAELLVFVEVKTRSYEYYGKPESSIDRNKELQVTDGAAAYMRQIDHNWAFRFDVISILLHHSGEHEINHFEDAFFPGLN